MYTQLMLYNKLKELEENAIKWIKMYDPIATGFMDTPYYVCYSGGKDSDCLRILFELSGVKYDLVHNHTTVEAPETVRYIRSIPNIIINYPEITMWDLIVKKMFPPTMKARYCCQALKESKGNGRFVATGVRWAESRKRKNNRGYIEVQGKTKNDNIILNSDNDESRRIIENCQINGKRILNPIVSWSSEDVWQFLNYYNCKSNPLYKRGYKRIGCIGCPLATKQKEELEVYQKYKLNYIRTFGRMLNAIHSNGRETTWQTGEDVYNWWTKKVIKDNQFMMNGQIELMDL